MKSNKGWWMILLTWIFCFCVGSLMFTVTNLKKNHDCTWAFSISKEIQLSTTTISLIAIVVVFCFYGVILTKYYKRRRQFDSFKLGLQSDYQQPKFKEINFSKRSFQFLPIQRSIKCSIESEKPDVQLKQTKSISETGEIFKIDLSPIAKIGKRKKETSLSKQLTFHVSYLKSSNYVLVTLFSFWMFHSPLFVYQTVELIK